jgi:hypothetical protein
VNEEQVIAAVAHLNELLLTLPDTTPCSLEGLWPEFDYPDHSPGVYLVVLEAEMRQVEERIIAGEYDEPEALDRLMNMLMQCAVALRQAGV